MSLLFRVTGEINAVLGAEHKNYQDVSFKTTFISSKEILNERRFSRHNIFFEKARHVFHE